MTMRDKVVVITGASNGIGAELARQLGEQGAKLALGARSVDKLAVVGQPYDALTVATDVTSEDDCRNLIERTVEHFGRIDVLVNNAGISQWALLEEVTDLSLFRRIMDVNYHGTVACTYYALPHLKQSKGLIVGISSLTGKTGVPTRSAYAASKHAMQGFLDSVRVELMGSGVDVLVVSPGFVASDVRYNALGPDGQPRGESHLQAHEADVMPVDECVRQIIAAMDARKRDVIIGNLRSRMIEWLRLIVPGTVDRVARRAIEQGGT